MRSLILAAVVAIAGCSKHDDAGPSCAQVTDHLFEVTKQAYPGHGDMAMGNRKLEIENCTRRQLSAAERRCVVAALDLAGVAKCRAGAAAKD